MAKKIIMLYGKGCLDSIVMMPILMGMNRGNGKYKFEFQEVWHDPEGQKVKENFKDILPKGKENAVPMFIDEEEGKASHIPNFEGLMRWLLGPEWWKN